MSDTRNAQARPACVIRAATAADAATIHAQLRALAGYLGQEDMFTCTVEDVLRDGFGEQRRFDAVIAEVDGEAVGLSLFMEIYSSFTGRPCLYLDSLYVSDRARGLGVGRDLVVETARIAEARGCYRLDLHVASGNPARAFYRGLGLGEADDLLHQVKGEALTRLARRA